MYLCDIRYRVDFDKVETIEDLKLILKALEISWKTPPHFIMQLVERYDDNVKICNLNLKE